MAINDIDDLRREFPGHFQNRDSRVPEGYLRIPTNEPGPAVSPPAEGGEADLEVEEARDPAEVLEDHLAEPEPSHDLEPLDPEAREAFGGHPGGIQDDFPWEQDGGAGGAGPRTTVIERLAFYLPFHNYRDWWGIYIFPEGILKIRQEMQPFFQRHGIGPREQVRFAKQLLYFHEFYHHAVESFGARLEAISNQPCYLNGFSIRYQQTFSSPQCLEETCANSYAREKIAGGCRGLGISRADVAAGINNWFSGQPPGYREAANTNRSWGRNIRPLLYEDYIQATLGIGPPTSPGGNARVPISGSGVQAAWSAAGYLDRGIGDIRARIAYLIPKGSPIYNRLPTDVRTCVKGRNFKQKLRDLGIARFHRHGTKHDLWIPVGGGRPVSIPRHDGVDIPKGTMRGILSQLGASMSIDDFLAA